MGKRKDEIEQKKADVAKAVRTAIRLRHSIEADREINQVLPDVLDEFDSAIAAGRPFELNVGEIDYGQEE